MSSATVSKVTLGERWAVTHLWGTVLSQFLLRRLYPGETCSHWKNGITPEVVDFSHPALAGFGSLELPLQEVGRNTMFRSLATVSRLPGRPASDGPPGSPSSFRPSPEDPARRVASRRYPDLQVFHRGFSAHFDSACYRKTDMALFLFFRSFRVLIPCAVLALGSLSHAQQVFRVTAIPDESPTELARKAAPLMKYLESRLGMKVEYMPVTDYAASVEALINKKVDMAWFGGFTFVQANARSGGKVIPLVQRAEDEQFKSVFITSDPAIRSLADLKGKDVSFGSQSSTSGHLMPRSDLLQAGVDPDKDFRRVAYSGAHDATIAAVASGKVQAGALNISVWEKFVADKKVAVDKVRVFHTTPPYHDYNWAVHADMPAAQRDKLIKAFLELDKSTPAGKEILELQRASRFVPSKADNYKGIEAAARSAGLL